MRKLSPSASCPQQSDLGNRLIIVLLMGLIASTSQAQFSYSFTTSSVAYTNIAGGTNVTTGGSAAAFLANDAHSDVIPLGFTFRYNGVNVTQVKANTNGWLAMSTGLNPNANQGKNNAISSPNGQATPSICPLWDDLSGVGGTATYLTTGSAPNRVFAIEWRNWRWDASAVGAVISFKCSLFETTDVIEFTYSQGATAVNNGSGGASIGLTTSSTGGYYSLNNTGTNPTASTTVGTNNLSTRPATGQVYRFTPCTAPAITSTGSNSPVCSTNVLNLSVVATGTAPSYAWSGPGSITNGTTANASVTGAASGNYTIQVTNGCGTASATVPVTVTPLPAATIAYTGSPYCSNAGTASVTRTGTANGTYSSTAGLSIASNTGSVQLGTSTPGTYTVSYSISAGGGCPQVTVQSSIAIQAATTWYQDADGDGLGDPNSTQLACSQPVGFVANNTDLCPTDANKQAPGQCGCGVADTDSDNDGTANCNDGCPNDPDKIAPGICGCGVADTDTDSDGTADCNDLCPNDPLKIAPGQCGCGNPDTDTDSDGTADCNDLCPNDANKTAPGICGCGVSDVDTDGDATADCNDLCPLDANKTAPGVCGCGVADTDSDGDGTANCIDGCPADPLKIAPGICGCGVADTDSDGDGTANCIDGCPADPLKIAPGTCGCGVSDVDTDVDGTADCNDGCPNDPNKIAPGICGCGVSDVDTDVDGTADCSDGCPNDPNKIAPGICGCGVSDVDTDVDGTADCNDGCPNDPNKTAPGICGCGNPDTDTDLDGTADCVDGCPTDPDKIAAGACGCETPDTDTDGDGLADCVDPCVDDVNNSDTDSDGTPDCIDNCPSDPLKQNPGACGCGVADVDTDGDTSMDCVDGCPNDPNKIAPGVCGCGVADADGDGDGTLNCLDGCPTDPNKVAPGVCGCGVTDTDTDGDGLADCNDSCPLVQGQIGSACNDGNANTINDVLTNACVCAGTPVANLVGLALTTDNDAASTSWEIIPLADGPAVCNGGGYPNSSTQTLSCNLQDGCYRLRVFDANMDGMCCMNGLGGYVLRTASGQRIIDAAGAGIFSSTAEVALGFCLPIGVDKLTPSRCDRENYLPSDFIQATPNAAVQAQFGVGTQSDDGYQFWIFNPNGGYSRRVLMTHASNNYMFPAGPDRCSYLRFSNLSSSPIPQNMLLNVRVRSMVNGVYSEFGSACRLKVDLTNQCPTTQLLNNPSDSRHSCGLVNVPLNGSRTLYAAAVTGATNYQFEFSKQGYLRKITMPSSSLNLTMWYTMPLQYNSTYNVRVRVSFDSGANFCPFSGTCTLSTAATPPGNQNSVEGGTDNMDLVVWPNPNRGEMVTLKLAGFGDENEQEMTITVTDLFGKQVYSERSVLLGDMLNTILDMQGYAAGIYLVNVSTADHAWTKRVIVQ